MAGPIRFHAEHFLRANAKEVDVYAKVFSTRVARAFDTLKEEAEKLQQEEYDKRSAHASEWSDPLSAAEDAYFVGVELFLTTDAIRQGVVNLMVVGLFHILEQHIATLIKELPAPQVEFDPRGGALRRFRQVLTEQHANLNALTTWQTIDELRLVANTVKHGDGKSAEQLRKCNPKLFQDPILSQQFPDLGSPLPLKPLVGEGLHLTEEDFTKYADAVRRFWDEVGEALLPVFCPEAAKPPPPSGKGGRRRSSPSRPGRSGRDVAR